MSALEQLLALLQQQREACLRLLELIRDERVCLQHSHLERLTAIVEEQTALLNTQATLSTRITAALDALAGEAHVAGQPTLAVLADHLPAPMAETLRAYDREITRLAKEIRSEGRINWQLAQQALAYVDFTLKLIGQAKAGPQQYTGATGAPAPAAVPLLMDRSA